MTRIGELPATSDPLTLDDLVEGERASDHASQQWTVGQLADAIAAPVPWTLATLGNSWQNYGDIYAPAAYRKVGDQVQVRGLVKVSTRNASPMFTLPAGYRPPFGMLFPSNMKTGSNGDITHRVNVFPSGAVSLEITGGFNNVAITGAITYLSLDAVRFSVTA